MNSHIKDITNQKFGRLTAIKYVGKKLWECVCDCGKTTTVRGALLRNGHTKSCGCFTGGVGVARSHGATANGKQTPEYNCWLGLRDRCNNPNNQDYKDYGARGITVCDRWNNSFENFLADMGTRPEGHTIDRIDNSKGYSPENCRWATKKQQANNRRPRTNKPLYMLDGELKPLHAWALDSRCVVSYITLFYRVKIAKMDLLYAMTTPPVKRK